ncbi:MAG: hypothetical protein ED555_13075 [Allomuricauda sp.]|nr:MAG: hypothetical protein ED555_13075 [Allomuricauda sp.]
MDELELLKKDWQKKEGELPKLSYEEIYKMIWKKSSSIVKWIFYISIIEFVLPHLLYLLPSARSGFDMYNELGITNLFIGLSILQYAVVFYFIYQFYRRYREISVLDNAKQLTNNILRTRRTVKNYVIFSLSMILLIFAIIVFGIYSTDNLVAAFQLEGKALETSPEKLKFIFMVGMSIVGVLFTLLLGGIYFLLYGLLTRKLSKNHKELKKLEV